MKSIMETKEVLQQALNLWWLRPENGLALASYVINGVSLKPAPGMLAADFACGDGVNTFFKCGGRFDPTFDLFHAGIAKQQTHQVAKQNIDVFDFFDEAYQPDVIQSPQMGYAYGTDHKQNLLNKAAKLGFYQNLVLADLRDTVDEISDHSLDRIYCNSLYWVAETEQAIEALKLKIKSDGLMILDVFTTEKQALDWGKLFAGTPNEWQQMLNRGRQITNPGLRSEQGWEALFERCGLVIEQKNNILPASLAHVWNLGLRPIFPMLNRMVGLIDDQNRSSIKQEWVEVFTDLLLPVLLEPQWFAKEDKPYRLQYVLSLKQPG